MQTERRKLVEQLRQQKLREVIDLIVKKVLLEGAGPKPSDYVPHNNTGLNVLEKLLKKIIPTLEDAYKSLTTSQEQRLSYRLHVLNGLKNILMPEESNSKADNATTPLKEKVSVAVKPTGKPGFGQPNPSKLIDVDGRFAPKKKTKEEEAAEELKKNTIPGTDLTGRNFALDTIKQISSSVLEAYESLSQQEDKDMFYDYLITNCKLYFNRFEEELSSSSGQLQEPTTPSGQQSGV